MFQHGGPDGQRAASAFQQSVAYQDPAPDQVVMAEIRDDGQWGALFIIINHLLGTMPQKPSWYGPTRSSCPEARLQNRAMDDEWGRGLEPPHPGGGAAPLHPGRRPLGWAAQAVHPDGFMASGRRSPGSRMRIHQSLLSTVAASGGAGAAKGRNGTWTGSSAERSATDADPILKCWRNQAQRYKNPWCRRL